MFTSRKPTAEKSIVPTEPHPVVPVSLTELTFAALGSALAIGGLAILIALARYIWRAN